jgi:cell division septation protein DedD
MTLPDANNTSTPRRRVMVKARVVAVVSAVVLSLGVLGTQLSPAQADAVTVAASADSYTRSDAATTNFGTSVRWSAQGITGYYRHGLLRFNVVVPTGQHVTGAVLRAYSESASSGAGVNAYATTGAWTETGVTWNTEPPRGISLGSASGYASGVWVSWNVTAGVPSTGGAVNLRLESTESVWLGFDSRENTTGRAPQLVVTTAASPSPSPTTTSPTPTPTPTSPTPTPTATSPSGQAMPVGNLPGWTQIFSDDFTTNVAIGSFPGTVYGPKWGAYLDGWKDTTGNGTYMPSKVLSVSGGALDYYVHTEAGVHMVSAPTPKIAAGAYGRYSVRFRSDALHGYKTAWLLWPDSGVWPADGEIDWPEGNLDGKMSGYMHFADPAGGQNAYNTAATYPAWHTATTEWVPGKVVFSLDGAVIGTSTTKIPTKAMHWVLQTETSTDSGVVPADATAGHVQVDWAVAYKQTTASPSPTPTTTSASPSPSPTPTQTGGDIVIAAVGDINGSGVSSTTGASGLNAASIAAANPAAVLTLGDNQYDYGSCATLVSQWDKTGWGGLLPKIIGTAGPTHDWSSASDTSNYRDHMAGACAGQINGKSLADTATGTTVGPDTNYVVDLGAWRVISMSSGLWRYDTAKANAGTTFLSNALNASDAAGDHVIVIWHEPYWTSTTGEHTRTLTVKPWIDLLTSHHVPLLLDGHQHGYERFYPQNGAGVRDDALGTQEIITGTGGIGFYPWLDTAANVAVHQTGAYGWLKLTLHADGHYAYTFMRTSGGSFSDSGSR